MKAFVLIMLIGIVLAIFMQPIANGFHVGCNQFDHLRTITLGIEFCK
jgi:hypothetical protein